MGVRRALKLTLDAVHDPAAVRPIATDGPLIHNRQVLEALAANGVTALQESGGEKAGTVIVRAHGIPPQRQQELSERCRRLVDATCPHVRKVQRIAEEYCAGGWHCIIVGDAGHAEVEGVLSYSRGRGLVVSTPQDVGRLPQMERVVVVAQTTQNEEAYRDIVDRLKERFPECKVFDTICRSTQQRQSEAKELAQQVDAMVVVGGFDSANTRRLAEISAATGTPTFHVETEAQLDLERLLRCRTIGVTAGASTPHWMIRRVVHHMRSAYERRTHPALYLAKELLHAPIRTNLFLGGGAAAMVFACYRLLGLDGRWMGVCMALALFFILSQHLLNQYSRRDAMQLGTPERAEFFRANARWLLLLGLSSGGLAVFLASRLPGRAPLLLVLLGTLAGWLYSLQISRGPTRLLPLRWLRALPGAKEIYVGLAWAVTAAGVPALSAGVRPEGWAAVGAAMGLCFLLAGHRMLLTDLLDLESDQLVGRETLASVLGERTCKHLVLALLAAEATMLLTAGLTQGWTRWLSFGMLITVGYSGLCFLVFHRGKLPAGDLGEAIIDGTFYVCGLVALADYLLR